ncbi:MAG: hypothetical protein WD845_13575 [Pirellulales bacterium]
MDQLKEILGHVRKHHFWLLCVLCIVAGFAAWWMAAGSMSKDYASRKGAIDGKFNSLSTILQEPNFPNAEWQKAAEDLTAQQKEKVRTAWQQVYDEQAPYLKWPEALGEAFRQIRSQNEAANLPAPLCERYASVVHLEFPKLLEIIGADPSGKRDEPGAAAANPAMSQAKVVWDAGSQDSVRQSLVFKGGRPSPLEVWVTQENLWVYRVLMTILKNINADRYVPPVKEIKRLSIAQDAAKEFERGLKPGFIEMPSNMPENAGGGSAAGGASEYAAAPAAIPGAEGPRPDQGRYLDATGKPMAAGAPQGPFKRMPVYMELVVDEREIPKLLVECANSPLPVEVHQLRVAPAKGTNKSTTTAPGQGGAPAQIRSSYDVPVEISGIIYIYNPPDTAKLGSGDAAAAGVPGQ